MIEKGSLQPGDRLVAKFKGETYHALVQAKNGDGTFMFEALDGPKSGTTFKSLSSLGKAIVGQMARRVQLAEDERLIEVLVAALKDLIGIRNHLSRQYKEAKTRAEEALDKAKKWGDGLPWE